MNKVYTILSMVLFLVVSVVITKAQTSTYSETFTNGVSYSAGTPQYDDWITFRNNLTPGGYTTLTMKGTYDAVGRICSDPVIVNQIANWLKNNTTTTSWVSGGITWTIYYGCNTGPELTADGTTCTCATPNYSVRPQIGNTNWGGVNTAGCSGPNQNMQVIFQGPQFNNDAGITAINVPQTPISPGVSNVSVTLKNWGKINLTSATIGFKIDGVTQTPTYSWSGTLVPSASTSTPITIGSYNFTLGNHTIKAWTQSPNGVLDSNNLNDTATYVVNCCMSRSGTYYIDNTGNGDFTSFSAAVNSISGCGISGPVNFIVRPGTYTDQVTLNNIAGVSATNTITFTGQSRTGVILTCNTNLPTIRLSNVSYVTFQNMTILNSGSTYFCDIAFKGNATYNNFINCQIEVPVTCSSYYIPIMFANTDQTGSYSTVATGCDHNLIQGCTIKGGYFGVTMYGSSTTTNNNNYNQFIGNTFTDQCQYCFYRLYAMTGLVIKNNKFINMTVGNSGYAILSEYASNTIIDGNIIQPGYMGIYLYLENYYLTGTSQVINNMISNYSYSYGCYGLYLYESNNLMIQHNTIAINATNASYSYYGIYMYYTNYYSGGGTLLSSRLENNYFINYSASGMGNYSYSLYSYYVTLADMDYNDYYYPNSPYIASWYGSTYSSLAQWQASYPAINVHSMNVDPDVISYTNLHLNPGSHGIVGILTNVLTDVDGDRRCTLQSFLGADEPVSVSTPADFITADTVCYITPVTFVNKGNINSPHIAYWYVNNVFKSNDFNLIYSFNAPGYDSIKLSMQTCAGVSSMAKRIFVALPTKAPSTEFVASKNVVESFEPVYINDVSTNCPNNWKWKITPDTILDPVTKILTPTFDRLNNTNDTSQNLAISFRYSGTYSVCLTTMNTKGTGGKKCKTDYITVKFIDNMCGSTTRTTELYGSLYDDGGSGGNFTANGQTCKYLIKTCSDKVKITFREFNLPAGSYLRLYDGINSRGIPMWRTAYGANGITGLMSDTKFDTILWATKSGMVYVEFQKGYTSGSGFKFEWESVGKGNYTMPTAQFTSPDSGCIVYPFAYKNTSLPGPNSLEFYWDFDGNNTIDANTVDGIYIPTFTGLSATYKTRLIAENCGGMDTFVKSVVLINPLNIANSAFSANVTKPVIYQDQVTLTPTGPSLECVNQWKWIINPSGKYYYVTGYSNASQYPKIVFTDTVCYDVTLIVGNTNSSSTQTISKTCYIRPITYCTPKILILHQDIGISRVKIGTIDNSSQIGISGYTSYTNMNGTDLFVGQKYDITVERITNYNAINRKVWIDYNKDGIFDDVTELVAKEDSAKTISWVGSFIVPPNAPYGATVLRIGTAYSNYPNNPCGPNYFGEFEDYRVFVKQDNIPPVITIKGLDTVYVEKGYPYIDSGATAWDNINGNLTDSIKTTNNVDTTKTGRYNYTYNVCDFLNNCAIPGIRTVIVTEDKTPPVLTLIDSSLIYWNVNIPYVDPGYTAYDRGDGDITSQVVVSTNLNFSILGTYTIKYTITDSHGYTDTKTRTVIIRDKAAPSISLIGANTIYVNINTTYTEPGVVYADNYWPNNKIVLQVTGLVDVTTIGTYNITYSVTDASGNGPNSISRRVIVYDSVAPVISTSGDDVITLEVYNQFYDPGVNIKDNSTNGLTIHKYGNFYDNYPSGYPTKIGNYIVFYYVTDQAGNKSNTLGRIIQVVDATAPKLELKGDDYIFVQRWQTYTDAGYTVSDNYDANKDITVDMQSTVNTLVNGLYSVCYTATDLSGNQSPSVCRLVRVVQQWSGINDPSASKGVRVYPNPTTGKLIIELKLDKSDNARIVLLNLLGEEVRLISDGKISATSYDVNMNDLSNGVYMLKIQTDTKTILERVVLSR